MFHADSDRPCPPALLTRRQLLRTAAAVTLGSAASYGLGDDSIATRPAAPQAQPPSPGVASSPSSPWWMALPQPRSRVVDIRSESVITGTSTDLVTLDAMLERSVRALTQTDDPHAAWRALLGKARRIVLKFNMVGATQIGTTPAMARVLVAQIVAAGYPRESLVAVELPEYLREDLEVAAPEPGWGETIPVGGQSEPLAGYFLTADAVVNVPFLKTHQIAGMSGCLKNISHAVIRHPARWHANGCSPFVPEIISAPAVSSRLWVHVMNALRIVIDRGPDAQASDVVPAGALLVGLDPVAVDSVGLRLLAVERRRRNLPAEVRVPYLAAAADMRLGRWRPADIEHIVLEAR